MYNKFKSLKVQKFKGLKVQGFKIHYLFIVLIMLLSGCIINISLFPQEEPLREQIIEGKRGPKILLIPLTGTITEDGKNSQVALIKEQLQIAERDERITGIIIRIDSPGGTVNASDVLYHEIKRFKETRAVPVYCLIDGVGASGAYYIAMACDKVYATPSSITGSIGVIAMKFNVEALMSKIGIQHEVVKSGDKKDFWSPFRHSTPEEKEIFQGIINELYERFLKVIHTNRKTRLKMEDLKNLADGRVFTSDQALKEGLIDGISYIDGIVEDLKNYKGLKEVRLVRYYRPGTYRPTVYSLGSEKTEADINLLLSLNKPSDLHPIRFMYLWVP